VLGNPAARQTRTARTRCGTLDRPQHHHRRAATSRNYLPSLYGPPQRISSPW
jgi:hypothetical protein